MKKKRYDLGFGILKKEIKKSVVGQEKIIDALLRALICNNHVLIEGVPGIAKTLLIRTLAAALGCDQKRIQCTPDLLPTDVIGLTSYQEGKGFYTIKGPVFSNFVLVDEINRANPKTQSAFLEVMQEKQATIGKKDFEMPEPFFVMATQNPVEQMGTYPLPEAQVDRFLFKLNMGYPSREEEQEILQKNMTTRSFDDIKLKKVFSKKRIQKIQSMVHEVYLDEKIEKYITTIIDATRNPKKYKIRKGKYLEWGCSPRGSIALYIASKAEALMNNRGYVTPQDVKTIACDVMRHRLILNYEGQAEGVSPDSIAKEILSKIKVP